MVLTRSDLSFLIISLIPLLFVSSANADDKPTGVTYDARSLIVNGQRELLFCGSIHYPRSTPDMWPDLFYKAKRGGLNVIQTYVFWNIHEPLQGQFNFEGNYDVVKFIKMAGEHGLYVYLRVGPFIQAEWNHGGFPYWLREVPGVIFRSDNAPFKFHMERYVRMVVEKMKAAKLYASQGGPIILSQIENEYNTIQLAYRHLGDSYVQWAGNMALSTQTGVPWTMCKQKDAPGAVINTCNGRHCGDTFTGPNAPNKPYLWTENWTAQFRVFGDPPSQRSAEDTAFSVARWFSKNGSLVNYYMYHGGTNLDRTAASFVTTRYYDEGPLDEFGLERQPKYGHLKDLHRSINLCRKPLLWGTPGVARLSPDVEARWFEIPGSKECAAFLTNNNSRIAHTVNILPDCKTVVFNTMTIVSQHNSRNFVRSENANKNLQWEMWSETIPSQLPVTSKTPLELYSLTKDQTDYAWYTTTIVINSRDLSLRKDILPVLRVASLGHSMLAFVNGVLIGSAHGSQVEKSFVLQHPVTLKPGVNTITLLGNLVGLPDSGAYMEHRYAGPKGVAILGLNTGTLDMSMNGWGHQVGLNGEKDKLYTEEGLKKVQWKKVEKEGPPMTWYKTIFDEPEGKSPVAVKMTGMKKGVIWINGKSIGRYWLYHIPRSYIKPKDNLMVILEEESASIADVEIMTVNRDTICSIITDDHVPSVKSWERKDNKFRTVVDDAKPGAHLKCPGSKKIEAVEFASFGDPFGACGDLKLGNCNSAISKQVVEQKELFMKENDACPDVKKTLAIQVKCG
ncbi:hypothetical protein K2173_012488 [Erythroxylum novogranatense]|uniref:Beta-galactosidase n=1 Tax=Erythroxylum novogranatense TaxID=1862640 RepID=A0AAV8TLT9_9ROSI|nr:hypothetical protein K2173_012488 [Erythroxylum novogranatense]